MWVLTRDFYQEDRTGTLTHKAKDSPLIRRVRINYLKKKKSHNNNIGRPQKACLSQVHADKQALKLINSLRVSKEYF